MKYILRLFGLIRLKDLNKYFDDEIKYWKDKRENIEDVNDILSENRTNQYSNYRENTKRIKAEVYFLNRII